MGFWQKRAILKLAVVALFGGSVLFSAGKNDAAVKAATKESYAVETIFGASRRERESKKNHIARLSNDRERYRFRHERNWDSYPHSNKEPGFCMGEKGDDKESRYAFFPRKNLSERFYDSLIRMISDSDIKVYDSEDLYSGYYGTGEIQYEYETSQSEIYRGRMESVHDANRDKMMRALWGAIGDTFKSTDLGKKVKKWGKEASRYFRIDYIRFKDENCDQLYIPGEMTLEQLDKEKACGISLEGFFYTNADSMNGDLSIILSMKYYGTQASTEYEIDKERMLFSLSSREFNNLVGTDVSLGATHCLNDINEEGDEEEDSVML